MTKTYVVFLGRKPGIYDKWSDAHAQVYQFPGSCYKGYNSREEAYKAFDQIGAEEPQVGEGTYSSSTSTATSSKTYVVFVGRKPGIYDKWSDAHAQVYRFPGSCYKGYNSREEAHKAFDQIGVEEPQVSEGTYSSSTSTATSGGRVDQSRNLATCLKSQSELASDISTLCLRMEKLCEEIKQELDSSH